MSTQLDVIGTEGRMRITRPYHPHVFGSKIILRTTRGRRTETTSKRPTYTAQLEAFRDAIADGADVPTGVAGAVTQIRALDRIYGAAGVAPRN